MNTLEYIRQHQLIAILRGADPDDVLRIAEALYEGGIRLLEITMNSKKPLKVIGQLAETYDKRMLIGAGTVLDPKSARDAVDAGAKFILSPVVSKKTIKATKNAGALSIPGAFTPTEILEAYQAGGDIIKVFPAGSGGAAYIRDVMGPLSHIPMLPTGGINLDNIRSFTKIGVAGYGIGSSLVDSKQALSDAYIKNLTERAQQFVQAIKI